MVGVLYVAVNPSIDYRYIVQSNIGIDTDRTMDCTTVGNVGIYISPYSHYNILSCRTRGHLYYVSVQ